MTILFGTGHRPEDSGFTFSEMVELASFNIRNTNVEVVISGMAAGFDLALACAAEDAGIDVWSVRPWAGHTARREDRALYEHIDRIAARHVITNDSLSYPGPWVYQVRNEWMVDNAERGVAFWSGKESGGTWNCLKYADKKKVPVHNVFPGNEGLVKL